MISEGAVTLTLVPIGYALWLWFHRKRLLEERQYWMIVAELWRRAAAGDPDASLAAVGYTGRHGPFWDPTNDKHGGVAIAPERRVEPMESKTQYYGLLAPMVERLADEAVARARMTRETRERYTSP